MLCSKTDLLFTRHFLRWNYDSFKFRMFVIQQIFSTNIIIKQQSISEFTVAVRKSLAYYSSSIRHLLLTLLTTFDPLCHREHHYELRIELVIGLKD